MATPPALSLVLPHLRCPLCVSELTHEGPALQCRSRHTFDIARQGYLSLMSGQQARSGDDDEMILARDRFLSGGAYAPLAAQLTRTALEHAPAGDPFVVEVGCGTGHYLAALLEAWPQAVGFGFDSARRGARISARAHPRLLAATADAFAPFPVASGSASVLFDVFSPRNPEQFARVLRHDGVLVVARPAQGHLQELRDRVPAMVGIDPEKEARLHAALDPLFVESEQHQVDFTVDLSDRQRAADLIGMTPSARHLDPAGHGAVLPEQVSASVVVSAWKHRTK